MSDHSIGHMTPTFREIDWTYLRQLDVDITFRELTKKPNCVIQIYPPKN